MPQCPDTNPVCDATVAARVPDAEQTPDATRVHDESRAELLEDWWDQPLDSDEPEYLKYRFDFVPPGKSSCATADGEPAA